MFELKPKDGDVATSSELQDQSDDYLGSPASAPVGRVNRQTFVDLVRGFALFGILLVNLEYILQPSSIGWKEYRTDVDLLSRWVVITFGEAKIYPLFALLFGYGLSLQMKRTVNGLGGRYRRRMIALVVMGVVHGVLFFPGDILVIYGTVGAVAYRWRNRATKNLIWTAGITYAVAVSVWVLVALVDLFGESSDPSVSSDVFETLTTGSFFDVAQYNIVQWLGTLAVLMVIQGPAVFAMFLTGHALGRTDWLSAPEHYWKDAQRLVRIIGPIALGGSAIGGVLQLTADVRWHTLGFAIGFLVAPLMAASYLIILSRLFGTKPGRLATLLRSSGRMSLSIYLLESAIATTLSFGYGFGLIGRVSPLAGIGVSIAIWFSLSIFAQFWLKRFRFGPFEWLLRSITYQKRQNWSHADKTPA